jgi:Golgi complex component 7 (COG7).
MKCGFGISDGLDTIDKILSAHLGEISIAFHTLLANSLSIQKSCDPSYSNGFDEQQIHCALDVLKIAGDMRTQLDTFHENVRDRIRLLANRMEAAAEQRLELSKAMNQNRFNSSLVPDSLSVAEIEILLAIDIHGDGVDHDNSKKSPSITALRMRSKDVDMFENNLFPKSLDSLSRLIKNSQQFVFDICAAVPLHFLNDMYSLPIWSKEDNLLSNITSTSYGTLPQSYITQVGEHLLALVQALEPFASDKNALNVAISVMDGLEHVNLKYWRNFANALSHGHNDDDFINSLRRGENMKNSLLISTENEIEDEEDFLDENEVEAQQFCNQWLDVICSSVTGVLLENTMRIEYLTPKGCEHFCTDLNYIVNVLTALGVSGHPHPLLIHVLELLKLSAQELESRIINAPEDVYSLRNIETRLLQIRRQ